MSVTQVRCPACSAPVLATPDAPRTRCAYCGSPLVVASTDGELSLRLTGQVTEAVAAAGVATRSELQRQQQRQEVAHLELRLQVAEGEMRSLERLPSSPVHKRQLAELRAQAADLRGQLARARGDQPPAAGTPTRRSGRDLVGLLFLPQGRAGRGAYWGVTAALLVAISLLAALNRSTAGDAAAAPLALPLLCVFWALLWSYIAVAFKRYHDRDKSGWWVLICLIPVVGNLWQFVELALFPGTPGPNRYG